MEPDDAGRARKGTEHEHYSPVFVQVRYCLDTATGEIPVSDLSFAEHPEGAVVALGAAVDMPSGAQRSRGHEKDRLRYEEPGQFLIDTSVRAGHG
jgi:hypothetical protein